MRQRYTRWLTRSDQGTTRPTLQFNEIVSYQLQEYYSVRVGPRGSNVTGLGASP